jgi:hypothetical protein
MFYAGLIIGFLTGLIAGFVTGILFVAVSLAAHTNALIHKRIGGDKK